MRILIKTCKWETVEKHVTTRSLYKTIDFYNGVSLTKENIPYEKRIVKCYLDDKNKKTIKSTINNIDYKKIIQKCFCIKIIKKKENFVLPFSKRI